MMLMMDKCGRVVMAAGHGVGAGEYGRGGGAVVPGVRAPHRLQATTGAAHRHSDGKDNDYVFDDEKVDDDEEDDDEPDGWGDDYNRQ
jgi:hypothetical protein